MKLSDDKLYSKSHFLKYLKALGLPFSYPTLLLYERKKIIPKPRFKMSDKKGDFSRGERVYTAAEIIRNTKLIKEYLKKKRKNF